MTARLAERIAEFVFRDPCVKLSIPKGTAGTTGVSLSPLAVLAVPAPPPLTVTMFVEGLTASGIDVHAQHDRLVGAFFGQRFRRGAFDRAGFGAALPASCDSFAGFFFIGIARAGLEHHPCWELIGDYDARDQRVASGGVSSAAPTSAEFLGRSRRRSCRRRPSRSPRTGRPCLRLRRSAYMASRPRL